jgi:hypothetical protein
MKSFSGTQNFLALVRQDNDVLREEGRHDELPGSERNRSVR